MVYVYFTKLISPSIQVSVCTVVNASSITMAYDYPEMAKAIDFFFIMAYDESGTLHNGPNSGYYITQAGEICISQFNNLFSTDFFFYCAYLMKTH